jgi:hypothetical protein
MAPCTRVSVSNWNDYWSFAAIGMPPRPEDDDKAEDEEDDEEDEDREPAVIREPDE